MEKVSWMDTIETIEQLSCAYYAMVSLLSNINSPLNDDEMLGVYTINNTLFEAFESALKTVMVLHEKR